MKVAWVCALLMPIGVAANACQRSSGATPSPGSNHADVTLANCATVAEKLASFELGNYAPRETRDKVVADKQAACVAAGVSLAEGDCVVKAADRWAAAKCAPSLFPGLAASGSGDCGEVIARIEAAITPSMHTDPQLRAQLDRTMDVMRQSCAEDGWPDDLKQCVMSSPPGALQGMQACNDKMPKELQAKLTARLMSSMQGGAGPRAPMQSAGH
jgi:hypothetical protein